MQTTTLVGATVYPEDSGTNTDIDRDDPSKDNPDTDDAANIAQAFRIIGRTDAVLWGARVTYDSAASSIDISSGAAAIEADSARARYQGVTRYDVAFAVRLPAVPGLPITSGSVNHLWLHLPQTGNDEAEYAISVGTETPPTEPRLKIAEIDPAATNPVTEMNRGSEVAARSIVGDVLGSDDSVALQSFTDGDLGINSQGALVVSSTTSSSSSSSTLTDAQTVGGHGPSYYASSEESETIASPWTFSEPIDGDISGSAANLGGHAAEKYPRRDTSENITGSWTINNNRILTTADEGSIDAGSLGERAPTEYALRNEDERLTGAWTIDAPLTLTDSTPLRFGDDGEGQVSHDADAGELHVGASGESPYLTIPTDGEGVPEFPQGLSVGGSRLSETADDGTATLSDGRAEIRTGVTEQATFDVSLAADTSTPQNVKLDSQYFWDSDAGEHVIEIIETDTDMGNPTVHYRIERTS